VALLHGSVTRFSPERVNNVQVPDEQITPFAVAIHDHLELRRRNAALEHEMPLVRYMQRRPSQDDEADRFREGEDTLPNVLATLRYPARTGGSQSVGAPGHAA
jgi:hypothetical protein